MLASLYASLLYPPGYTYCTPVLHTTGYTAAPLSACSGRGSWAQSGRKAWVRASQRLKVLKGVMVGGALCAELLRFSRRKEQTDRIDEG